MGLESYKLSEVHGAICSSVMQVLGVNGPSSAGPVVVELDEEGNAGHAPGTSSVFQTRIT